MILNLFEVLNAILNDKDSELYLNEEDYKKSNKSNIDNSVLEFIPNSTTGKVVKYCVGSKKLNVNLKVIFEGQVLNKEMGLKMDANMCKEFTLIRNGSLYINKLVAKLSPDLLERCSKNKLIERKINDEDLVLLNFKNTSFTNKSFYFSQNIDKTFSYDSFIDDVLKLEDLKIQKNILQNKIKELKKSNASFNQYMPEKENNLKYKYRKEFNVNSKNIFIPTMKKEKEISSIYNLEVYNIVEWRIESPTNQERTNYYTHYYNTFNNLSLDKRIKELNAKLEEVIRVLDIIQNKINICKIVNALSKNSLFEKYIIESKTKSKKSFDKELNVNLVLGENATINKIKLKKSRENKEIEIVETKYILIEKGKSLEI